MKILKRFIFAVLVIIYLAILFFPNMIYWLVKGHDFLSKVLDNLYIKWVLDRKDPRLNKDSKSD